MPDRFDYALTLSIIILLPLFLIMIISFFIKKSIAKKILLLIVPIFIFSIFYCSSMDFYYFVNFNIFPSRKCIIENSSDLSNSNESIKLPTKSMYMYGDPGKVYFTEHEVNKCVDYFKNTLVKMKKNKKIKTFEFNVMKKEFDVEVNSGKYYRINVEKYNYLNVSSYAISSLKDDKAHLDF